MERPWSFESEQTRTTKEQADVQASVLREFDEVQEEFGDNRKLSKCKANTALMHFHGLTMRAGVLLAV